MTRILVKTSLFAALAVAALGGVAGVRAWAAEQLPPTTQALYEDCSSTDQARRLGCEAYIAGVADMMRLIGSGIENNKVSEAGRADFAAFGICHHDYTGNELRQVFLTWAAKNPAEMTAYRLFGVRRAFHRAWSCT
jgi:hypothetical protein